MSEIDTRVLRRISDELVACHIAEPSQASRAIMQAASEIEGLRKELRRANEVAERLAVGVLDMILHCPECRGRHLDEGEWSTKPHHTHACQHCGFVWRPAVEPTRGVRFLPGFKNEVKP